jgi:hypothetical protein
MYKTPEFGGASDRLRQRTTAGRSARSSRDPPGEIRRRARKLQVVYG